MRLAASISVVGLFFTFSSNRRAQYDRVLKLTAESGMPPIAEDRHVIGLVFEPQSKLAANRAVTLSDHEIAALFRVLWYSQRVDALYKSLRPLLRARMITRSQALILDSLGPTLDIWANYIGYKLIDAETVAQWERMALMKVFVICPASSSPGRRGEAVSACGLAGSGNKQARCAGARSSARPDVFEDLAVTARRALVPDAASSGLAAAGSGTAKPLSPAARAGMMAEWPMMAARTGLDTTHGQLAVSRGRCCWPRARSSGPARTAWRSTWAAARAPMRWSCWLAAGWSWRSTLSRPGSRCSGHASRPLPPDGSAFCCASFAEADLPCAHLIHAGFSLPFCPPQEFPALWARIRRALAPGGVFAGQLFGTRDTWADDPDMTFHARHQAETLLDGLDILRLEETERDGHAFSGPKHWHTFDILARKPVSRHPSAPASR